jgi:hypothetical protein
MALMKWMLLNLVDLAKLLVEFNFKSRRFVGVVSLRIVFPFGEKPSFYYVLSASRDWSLIKTGVAL